MKKTTRVVLWAFIFSAFWVNPWPEQLRALPLYQSSSSFQQPQTASSTPKISASLMSLRFTELNVGSTSQSAITIKNTGQSDLVIISITISGNNPSDFSQANDCTTVPGGNSCAVTVTFGPTSGGKKSGIVSITSNDPKKPTINVRLSGSSKCPYSLSSSSQQCDASGGTWSVDVMAPMGCSWTASTTASWITVTSGGSGSGDGTVTYTVAPNAGTRQRAGKITIAKQTLTVTQAGAAPSCTYSISSTSKSFRSTGGTGSVSVTAQKGCNWEAASDADWITITSGSSGSGKGAVKYSIGANVSIEQRTGAMTIAGQTFTVTQSGAASPPMATLSEYQQALLNSYGKPDYLSIAFNSEPPYREEAWVYKDLGETYLFWDGESLGSTEIAIDPAAYSNPSHVDPSFFANGTKLPDLVELLESDYTAVESTLGVLTDDPNFKVYHFNKMGLFVAYVDGSLVAVQSVDAPAENATSSLTKSLLHYSEEPPPLLLNQNFEIIYFARLVFLGALGKYCKDSGYNFSKDGPNQQLLNDIKDECGYPKGDGALCLMGLEALLEDCSNFRKSQGENTESGISSLVNTDDMFIQARKMCTIQQLQSGKSGAFLASGNIGAAGSDNFPYCPGTAQECTGYAYSDWGTCTIDGFQERTVTYTPEGCQIKPPFPPGPTIQSCTPPSCTYTLSVTINPSSGGTVTINPQKSTYCAEDSVTLTATPNSGYTFSSWSGVDSSNGSTATVTMNGSRAVTANFTGGPPPETMNYHGSFNFQIPFNCDTECAGHNDAIGSYSFSGSVDMEVTYQSDGTHPGSVTLSGDYTVTCVYGGSVCYSGHLPLNGSTTSIQGITPILNWDLYAGPVANPIEFSYLSVTDDPPHVVIKGILIVGPGWTTDLTLSAY